MNDKTLEDFSVLFFVLFSVPIQTSYQYKTYQQKIPIAQICHITAYRHAFNASTYIYIACMFFVAYTACMVSTSY